MFSASDYRHRSVTLINVPGYLAARGIDPVEFLRKANVPVSLFGDANAFIPRELCFALEGRLKKITNDGMLGGHVANRYHLSELGPWGNTILQARTLREALSFAVSQIHILQTGFTLLPIQEDDKLILSFGYQGRSAYVPQQHILGTAVTLRKIALLAGVPEAIDVELQQPYSTGLSDLDELLGTRVQFCAKRDAVRIDLGIIDNAISENGKGVRPHVQTAWDVTAHIRDLLPYRRVTKDYVAALLGTSPRTVQRRLSEWGLSFEQLIDDIRRNEAVRLLRESQFTVSDIAAQVGYSDGPHFLRAFRRWTGTTPFAFRQANKQHGPATG